jgi:tetratricopeptide (TPR) repeat protein
MNSFFKKITFVLILIALFTHVNAQTDNIEKFKQGVEFYSAGQFYEAAEVWTELYNTGYRSVTLYYNIANAHFKSANIPKSLLFYERALLLSPVNEDINYNLQIARTFIVDRFQDIPELFFVKWFNIAALLISSNSWAIIGIVAFVICLISLSVYIYSIKYLYKIVGFWTAVLCLAVSLMSIVLSSKNNSLINNSQKAIIFSPSVNGKSSPDASGSDLFILHEGSKVSIEEKVGEWLEIRLPDGKKGWVPANCLEVI